MRSAQTLWLSKWNSTQGTLSDAAHNHLHRTRRTVAQVAWSLQYWTQKPKDRSGTGSFLLGNVPCLRSPDKLASYSRAAHLGRADLGHVGRRTRPRTGRWDRARN